MDIYTKQEKKLVKDLSKQGLSPKEISKRTNIKLNTVRYWKYKQK